MGEFHTEAKVRRGGAAEKDFSIKKKKSRKDRHNEVENFLVKQE